jgi:hypothetical protein
VKDKYLEKNSWVIGDLLTAREMIDVIVRDLESNGRTHVDYVLEKLERAENILNNINGLCLRNSNKGVKKDEDTSSSN